MDRSAAFSSALLDDNRGSFYFGGTSLLIVVGVAMDTVTQIEAQLIMRHYDLQRRRQRTQFAAAYVVLMNKVDLFGLVRL